MTPLALGVPFFKRAELSTDTVFIIARRVPKHS